MKLQKPERVHSPISYWPENERLESRATFIWVNVLSPSPPICKSLRWSREERGERGKGGAIKHLRLGENVWETHTRHMYALRMNEAPPPSLESDEQGCLLRLRRRASVVRTRGGKAKFNYHVCSLGEKGGKMPFFHSLSSPVIMEMQLAMKKTYDSKPL